MGIFKRLKDIITANINDMLDKIEDPEQAIDQMIKEMEESIIDLRRQTAASMASSKMTERKISELEKETVKWQKNAELAITEEQDDLARKAIARRREVSDQLDSLHSQLTEEHNMIENMKSDLHLVEEKVQEARRKRDTILMKKRSADARKKMVESAEKVKAAYDGSASSIINGFDSFSKYEDKIERELAEINAREELNSGNSNRSLESEFKHLQKDNAVEDELAELKKKLNK